MATEAIALTKSTLIDAISEQTGESKAAVGRIIDSFQDVVTDTLQNGGSVTLTGFLSAKVADRAARTGRNPSTGEELKIAASKAAVFKAGSKLKEAVNTKPTKKKK